MLNLRIKHVNNCCNYCRVPNFINQIPRVQRNAGVAAANRLLVPSHYWKVHIFRETDANIPANLRQWRVHAHIFANDATAVAGPQGLLAFRIDCTILEQLVGPGILRIPAAAQNDVMTTCNETPNVGNLLFANWVVDGRI